MRYNIQKFAVVMVVVVALAVVATPHPVYAQDCSQFPNGSEMCPDASLPIATATLPPGIATPPPGTPPTDTGTSANAGGIIRNITQIIHLIQFPDQLMKEAVAKMTYALLQELSKAAGVVFGNTLETTVFGSYGLLSKAGVGTGESIFATLIQPRWEVTRNLAFALLPATLALSAVLALRNGMTSVLGYADMKEALLSWLVGAVMAGSSYYLMELFHRLCMTIATSFLGDITSRDLVYVFFNIDQMKKAADAATFLVGSGDSTLTNITGSLIFLIGIVLGVVVLGALAIAGAAYIALVCVFAILAPVVIVLSIIPPMRWLGLLWLKALTLTLLIAPANSILLTIAIKTFAAVSKSGTVGGWVGGMLLTVGALSLLLTLDFKAGEVAFGAIAEMGQKLFGVVGTIAGLAAGAVIAGPAGAGIGAGLGSSLGGGSGSSSRTGDLAGGTGPIESGSRGAVSGGAASRQSAEGGSPANPAGSPADNLTRAQIRDRATHLTNSMGRALTLSSSNPLARGLGAGLMLGSDISAASTGLEAGQLREEAHHQDVTNSRQMALLNQQRGEYRRVLNEADSGRNGQSYPVHLSRPNYDTTGLFAEHLVRNIPEASYESAYRLSTTLHQGMQNSPNLTSRGALATARRNLYDTIGQQNNFTATELAGRINNWANSNEVGVTLPASAVSDIQALYYSVSHQPRT